MADPVDDFIAKSLASTANTGPNATDAFIRQSMGMPPVSESPGIVGPGLRAGFNELQALGGAAASALGGAVGYEPLQKWGADVSASNQAEAAQYGRPDLEVMPWREGGGGLAAVPEWLGYQAAKQIPLAGATLLGTALFPEAAVPAIAARAGAALPEFIGGGGLRAGMSEAAAQAAQETGKRFAQQGLGAALVNTPVGAGSMYQEAMERPGGPTREDAIKALALAPAYGALEGVGGALGRNIISEAATKGIAATAGRAALRSAVEEAPTEAAQTALELSFRPDLSPAQKASQIVDAAITGAAVGGVFGGSAGGINAATSSMRATKDVPPNQLTNDDIINLVDKDLGAYPNAPMAEAPAQPAVEPQPATEPAQPIQATQPEYASSQPPMQAQIQQAIAPDEEAAARNERMAQVQSVLAQSLGGDTKQNRMIAGLVGQAETLPDAANNIIDLLEQGTASKRIFKLANALGITDVNGQTRDLNAEIQAASQQLSVAQTPQLRSQLTAQIDQLENQQQILTAAAEKRQAIQPAEEPAPIIEAPAAAPQEQIAAQTAPVQEQVAPEQVAPEVSPVAQAATQAAADAKLTGRASNQFAAAFESAVNGETISSRNKNARAGFEAGLQYAQQTTQPVTETTNAVQEPGTEGVLSREPAQVGGPVGEGNTEGQIAVTREGAALGPETSEITPTAAPQEVAAPSPKAQKFMQQNQIKVLTPEERAAVRERQAQEVAAFQQRREAQIARAQAQNAARGGVTAAPPAQKGMTPAEFLARRNRERPAVGLPETESELDRDVSSLVENNASGKQILDYLGQNGATEFDRLYAQHLSRLGVAPSFQFEDVNNPELQLDREAAAGRKIYGSYNVEQDRVNLYERANAAQIAMHEATHAATDKAIRTNTPSAQKLKDIFNEFKGRSERYERESPAYDDESEFISEAFSNPDFREFLRSLKVGPKNLWEKFKDAVFKLLKLPQRTRTVFDQVMEVGEPLFRENQQVSMEDVYRATPGAKLTESPLSLNEKAKDIIGTVVKAADNLDRRMSVEIAARKAALGWQSITHMVARYSDMFKSDGKNHLQDYADNNQLRSAIAARMSQLFTNANRDYAKLSEKTQESVRQLMSFTEFSIDPRKTWAEQPWLHSEKNAEQLKPLVARGNQTWSRMGKTGQGVYENFKAINDVNHYAQMSLTLHNLIVSDPNMAANIANSEINPVDKFMDTSALHEKPQEAEKYWRETLAKQIADAKPYAKSLDNFMRARDKATRLYTHSKAERDAVEKILRPLNSLIKSHEATIEEMQKAPYFHLGRFGNQMVTFQLPKIDGVVDQEAKERVALALEKAGVQAQLSPETESSTVFIRLETPEAAQNLRNLVEQMQEKGWVSKDAPIKSGPRLSDEFIQSIDPAWLNKYIESIEASPQFDTEGLARDSEEYKQAVKGKEQMVSQARELWLNMLPDNALAKVLTHRKSVPGYSQDMLRSFAFRHQIGMNTIANLATAPRISQSLSQMRQIVNRAKEGSDVAAANKVQNVFSEISRRSLENKVTPENSFWDAVRAFNHSYFLGFSPSYVLVNLTQPGVLLWPELAKQHGFMKSAQAMAKVTPTAFNVMKATLQVGKSADAIITEDALKKSGVPNDVAEFIMRVVNTGNIDLGSTSRELGRVANAEMDSATDQYLRWAAAAGYYSETFTRLTAALAARDLYKNKTDTAGLMAYVNKTVNESMLNYSSWNTARQTGKMGIAGEYSPVMFSFMTYQFQVLEKMYREMRDAFGGSKEAQRFLAGHLTAITLLAGSLGLPFASVAARGIDALRDLFGDDDEPHDFKSDWRNLLADVFGKDIGEVLARGAPRALGFDVSSRVGEADIAPFSRLLTDRREWKDAASDSALKMLGSPVSMLLNMLVGGEKIADGDFLAGIKDVVPTAIKGPVEAYRMTQDGYVDNRGNEMPMTPQALDVMYQLFGFTPAAKAEYGEAKMAQTVRTGILTREASSLRNKIIDAIENKSANLPDLIERATRYDTAHPEGSILKSIAPAIKKQQKDLAVSRAINAPIGTRPQDIRARELTGYMNVDLSQ